MKILVTGVLGVVGSKLEEILLSKGHTVFGIDLLHTDRRYGHGLGKVSDENYFRCDISEYRQIRDVITHVKPDLIYNCAAEFGRWNGEYFYEKVWKTNAIGLKNIIRLQEELGFKLVHCSSSEVYGDYRNVMYEELLDNVAIMQMNDYAMSKRVNEMQIKNSCIMNNTETVVVRIFNTYGPGEWYHPFRSVNCLFTYNLLYGKRITCFKGHTRTSTYVYDCARTIANICENFKPGEIYNIASEENHTIEELVDLVLKYTGADPQLVKYVRSNEILTTKDKFVDARKASKDLNHKSSMSLDQGVKNTVEWMKKYYNIK
jgi:dTDP-glucose 4,6-dehydratase